MAWPDILRKRTQDWIYAELAPAQVGDAAESADVVPDGAYLSVFLRSAHVVDVRKGFKRFYGVVNSVMALPHRSGQTATFATVTCPAALKNADPERLDQVIQLDHRLLGPVPYVGGDLELEVGLFSIASRDLVAPYLELLETLAGSAGVSYLSQAVPFAAPIIRGINLLAGADDDTILEIGLAGRQTPPRPGHFVVIRAPKQDLDVDGLRLDPRDHRLLDAGGAPLAGYPYLVLEVRAELTRPDWFMIPELAAAHRSLRDEYRLGRARETEDAIVAFRRLALTCDDLLSEDAGRLVAKLEEQYLEAGPPRPARRARGGARELAPLEALDLYADESATGAQSP
jgi:hypothetical protein